MLMPRTTIRKLTFERQKPIPLVYKDVKLDYGYRVDILVDGRIVVELKSVDRLGPIHETIILTHLRLSGHKLGLLINFNVPLLKDCIKRFRMSD